MKARTAVRMRAHAAVQRGAATLVVVMVLFFIMSLVAAYAGRNLMFEQRTSVNQYRSTQALEAAEAGVEWSLAQLNNGRMDGACTATNDATLTNFRDRYLSLDPDTGRWTARLRSNNQPLLPTCVRDAAGLACDCPSDAAPVVAAPAGTGVFPAFRVRFTNLGQPGVVQLVVVGCTRLDENCLDVASGPPQSGDGRAIVNLTLAFKSGLPTPPAAALMAGGNVNLGGAALRAVNTDTEAGGLVVHARGAVTPAGLDLIGPPGSSGAESVLDGDLSLHADPMRRFVDTFGMWRQTWRQHPATIVLNCPADCDAANLQTTVALNPGRMLWLEGDADLTTPVDIGSAAAPALMVVNGDLTFAATPIRIYGLVYSRVADWTTAGTALIQGAAVAEGNVSGGGTPDIVYDRDILNRLRVAHGSFVRVPGSWRDF